ncbi:hypothetical protein FHG87_005730 [Trinorchestia longiramus]|nr:hypothetical protein FHG87_005730 [Trinorchestia longiramus]
MDQIMRPDQSLQANQNTKHAFNAKIIYCKGCKVRFIMQFFHIRCCNMDECRFYYASHESSHEIKELRRQLTQLAGRLEAIEKVNHKLTPQLQPPQTYQDKQLCIDQKQLSIDNWPHTIEIIENHHHINNNQTKIIRCNSYTVCSVCPPIEQRTASSLEQQENSSPDQQ